MTLKEESLEDWVTTIFQFLQTFPSLSTLEDDFLKGSGFRNELRSELDLCKPNCFHITMSTSIPIDQVLILILHMIKPSSMLVNILRIEER